VSPPNESLEPQGFGDSFFCIWGVFSLTRFKNPCAPVGLADITTALKYTPKLIPENPLQRNGFSGIFVTVLESK